MCTFIQQCVQIILLILLGFFKNGMPRVSVHKLDMRIKIANAKQVAIFSTLFNIGLAHSFLITPSWRIYSHLVHHFINSSEFGNNMPITLHVASYPDSLMFVMHARKIGKALSIWWCNDDTHVSATIPAMVCTNGGRHMYAIITSPNRPGLPDFSHTLKNMWRPGYEANSRCTCPV